MGGHGSGSSQRARTNLAEESNPVSVWTGPCVRYHRNYTRGHADVCLARDLGGIFAWAARFPSSRSQRVSLTTSQGTLGGLRWWFECPTCTRRCAKLYRPRGYPQYACRKCSRIAYSSQRESEEDRFSRQADKLNKRVGCRDSAGRWHKRKWIRRPTYRRTRMEADDLDSASMHIGLARIMAIIDRQETQRPTERRLRR